MDEYNTGMDPEIKKYFRKILNTFSVALFWMLTMATTGLFFELGITKNGWRWYNFVFYLLFLLSLLALIRYFYKTWNKKEG
ncbi:MAG: hypothetical protein ACJ75B_00530 [Flavisolibacter sp.]